MATPAHEFFSDHVVPNYNAFRTAVLDLRLAMNAAVAVNQMADHYWHSVATIDAGAVFHTSSPEAFRRELALRSRDWAILRDVAEAHKHAHLSRATRSLTTSRQSVVSQFGYGSGAYGSGSYGGKSIVVTLDNGEAHHFSSLAAKSVAMWKTMLIPFGSTVI